MEANLLSLKHLKKFLHSQRELIFEVLKAMSLGGLPKLIIGAQFAIRDLQGKSAPSPVVLEIPQRFIDGELEHCLEESLEELRKLM